MLLKLKLVLSVLEYLEQVFDSLLATVILEEVLRLLDTFTGLRGHLHNVSEDLRVGGNVLERLKETSRSITEIDSLTVDLDASGRLLLHVGEQSLISGAQFTTLSLLRLEAHAVLLGISLMLLSIIHVKQAVGVSRVNFILVRDLHETFLDANVRVLRLDAEARLHGRERKERHGVTEVHVHGGSDNRVRSEIFLVIIQLVDSFLHLSRLILKLLVATIQLELVNGGLDVKNTAAHSKLVGGRGKRVDLEDVVADVLHLLDMRTKLK